MLTLTNVTWLDLCLAGVGVYLAKQMSAKKHPAPYPPGPLGWPLIGNISDMPRIKPCITFAEWGKKYGDISHVQVLGQHVIVLNTVKTAMEMLDSKSAIYSDRPVFPMGGELVGFKDALPFLPYGDRFRRYRKNLHHVIGSRAAVDEYNQIEEVETHRFLKRVLAKPDQLQEHVRHTAGAVILRISYGYEVKDDNDPLVDLADRAMDGISQATAPGAFMVDMLPFLAKVPAWFPGAGFQRTARGWRETLEEMVSAPHKFVKDQMAAGIAPMSFTSNLLEGRAVSAEEESHREMVCFFSIRRWCRYAMTLFPDVQKKAQAEIDAVALVKEVHRWNVVSPTGFPHRVTEDDIHDGYYIPKGSMILSNIWSMLNDPRTYAKPSQFNPERFLANDGKEPEIDPRTICFGFGRRICPGLHLADASIWISAAMSLAVFDISKIIENGVEITPDFDPSSGSISHPKPFKCSIKPRSATTLGLIQQDANY
ncbi:cytochrome P450 [Suillus lakei]|nr:cytochrome P450 [Suillus lakei]